MRLNAAAGGAICIWSSTITCLAHAFGNDVAAGAFLLRRHPGLHNDLLRRDSASSIASPIPTPTPTSTSTPTPTTTQGQADVFEHSIWPTVSIPAGFTLAGGVMLTPLPAVAMSSVTGTAAMSSAMSAATEMADPATWNQQVDEACQTAMSNLNGVADNESGMMACYNVAYLDTQNGVFEADLRIFNVSAAEGSFAGVPEAEMMLTLAYANAQLRSNTSMSFPVRKRSVILRKRQPASATTSGVFIPNEVMSQKYLVQLNASDFTPGMNEADFRPLTFPNITITATLPDSSTILNASLSIDKASYLAGIFVGNSSQSTNDPVFLLNNPAARIQAASQGLPTPFTVPGLTLGVFPTGLIVTGTWVLIFTGVVGFGTLQRIRFRDQYRRDVKAQLDERIRRI